MKAVWRKTIIAGVVGFLALGWCGFVVYRMATATKTCTYRISYKSMPADDAAFTEWLQSQPGVKQTAVTRDGDTLIAVFVMGARDPEPAIVPACEKFGYAGWQGFTGETVMSPLIP
jgi:hypothetical protein